MAKAVKPIPDGYHTLTPYLAVKGAVKALEFYKKALGAEEIVRMPGPGGTIVHAEMKIGDSIFMLADEHPEIQFRSPQAYGGSPVKFYLYVNDVDAAFDRAVKAGAKVVMPVKDQFYGDRSGQIEDPFGHRWGIATHTEDLTGAEIDERAKKAGY